MSRESSPSNVPRGTKPEPDERIDTDKLLLLANVMGSCTLDGADARLEVTDNAQTARVRDTGGRTACFNWSVAQRVITAKRGAFLTLNRG